MVRPAASARTSNEFAPRRHSRCGSRHTGARVRPRLVGLRLRQCRLRQDPCAGAAGDPAAARRRAAGENPLHHLHQGGGGQHGGAGFYHARPLGHARRHGARCRDPRCRDRAAGRKTADARARAVRMRAGDAGRIEGADHPRAVHAAAAAVSIRGQRAGALCGARRARPGRDDGARQSQGAARCLARSAKPRRPRARYRHGQRRRRHLQGRGARSLSEPRPLYGVDRQRRQRQCGDGAGIRRARR